MPSAQAGRAVAADPEIHATDPAVVLEVAAWLGQLVRTLKTCRLYDEANPTVVRFREDLAASLVDLLTRSGTLRLDVSSQAIAIAGQDVLVARSRDDNLAGVLHRDGIRCLVFEPAIEEREVNSLVDQLLLITGPAAGDNDLVTLVWDADLPHVVLETVPIEGGEADGGDEAAGVPASASAWPRQQPGAAPVASPQTDTARSDDWNLAENPADLEQAYTQLSAVAPSEIARFRAEFETSGNENFLPEILQILEDCLAADLTESDRAELAGFVPRALREALAAGDWPCVTVGLRLLRACDPEWSVTEFAANLCGPLAITTRKVVGALDRQERKEVDVFLALARDLGPGAAEWLMHVLAESQRMTVRRPLTREIATLLDGHPERIASWLSDERWFVVRNVVHILGWMGGSGIAPYLRQAADHPEPRVRQEVVAAASSLDRELARPTLLAMLKNSEGDVFEAILQQIGDDNHADVAARLLETLGDPGFAQRPDGERRAFYRTLATRGDEVLPALDALLNEGGLFWARSDADRPAVALCIARIGTPAAQAVLKRGLRSKREAVRKACRIAGAGRTSHE